MDKQKNTWLNYMSRIRQQVFSEEDRRIDNIEQVLHLNQIPQSLFDNCRPAIYLLDYTTGQYCIFSNSLQPLWGHQSQDFLNHGISFTLENYYPKELHLYNTEIFPDRLAILHQIPAGQHSQYIFSYNFQLKNRDGVLVNLLQRNCFIKSDQYGNPIMSFGVITNVNHFKSVSPIIQVVEKINSLDKDASAELIFKKSYFPNKEDSLFSKREKEILPYLAAGHSSKEIAHKLFISEFTVINHRRNMMLKTGCLNVTQLVCFALTHCII